MSLPQNSCASKCSAPRIPADDLRFSSRPSSASNLGSEQPRAYISKLPHWADYASVWELISRALGPGESVFGFAVSFVELYEAVKKSPPVGLSVSNGEQVLHDIE